MFEQFAVTVEETAVPRGTRRPAELPSAIVLMAGTLRSRARNGWQRIRGRRSGKTHVMRRTQW
jgi:hypothetical protein